MSKYKQFSVDQVRGYPIRSRHSKVGVDQFYQPQKSQNLSSFLDSLPALLAAQDLRDLVKAIKDAREKGKPIIWGYGGHVIKVGLGPLLIELMDHGLVTALATNGSGMIHDFEIGLCGKTSEDVEKELQTGDFGMAEETGEGLNCAIKCGVSIGLGIGESVGAALQKRGVDFPDQCVLLQAYKRSIPVTVHVAVGTDIIHMHPAASGKAIGQGSLTDFRIFADQVSRLGGGGVYLNIGSAVILPEVFLKAVSLVRNAGCNLEEFVTANLDFIQHYRPRENVVRRPVLNSGRGFSLTGHHEIMVPLLAGLLLSPEAD